MSSRPWWLAAVVVLLAAGGMARGASPSAGAGITCEATGAGQLLPAADVHVTAHAADDEGRIVGRGIAGELLPLPPGRYDVRMVLLAVPDHEPVWRRGIDLGPGETAACTMEFTVGRLSIEAPGAPAPVTATLFAPDDHDRALGVVRDGEPALLVPGLYDVRAVLTSGAREQDVAWVHGVAVDAGGHTRRQVRFDRGGLRISASNAGEALPRGTVDLAVFREGDDQEEVVEAGPAGSTLSLEAGVYDVRATFSTSHDAAVRWLRSVAVGAGENREEAIAFSSGSVVVDASRAGGVPLGPFDAYVYYYPAGDHRLALAYTPAGETAILEAGRYDLRVHYFRSADRPDLWLRDVPVEAGRLTRRPAVFASGRLLVRVRDDDGTELVGDDVFLYVHAAGERTRPLLVARSSQEIILTAGTYDLHIQDTRHPHRHRWLPAIKITPDHPTHLTIKLGV